VSERNLDPETIPLGGGDYIEVHPAEYLTASRQPDGAVTYGVSLHTKANVRVFLPGEDGFFAFPLSPEQARALAASVDRHCPDAGEETT
jgi:hypothetical protein